MFHIFPTSGEAISICARQFPEKKQMLIVDYQNMNGYNSGDRNREIFTRINLFPSHHVYSTWDEEPDPVPLSIVCVMKMIPGIFKNRWREGVPLY